MAEPIAVEEKPKEPRPPKTPPQAEPPKLEIIPAKERGEGVEIKGATIDQVTARKLIRPGSMLEVRDQPGNLPSGESIAKRNSGYHKVWVRNRGAQADQNVDMRRAMGYTPATTEHYAITTSSGTGSIIQVGDLMLMEMPKELQKRHQQATDRANYGREQASRTHLTEEMRRIKDHPAGAQPEDLVIGE